MYVFTDPKVSESFQKVVNAYGKFGEHIRITASEAALQLSVVNASLTAIGTCVFKTPLFSGPGAKKNVHVKSRALDYIFKRLENEDISALQLRFRTTRTGQEQLEVQLDCGNNIKKIFRVACLNTAVLPMDFEPEGSQPFTFECIPSVLKDALASCEAGADEVKVNFQHNLVNILARRRGIPKGDFSALRSGLRTIINLQPETFRQVTIATPRQVEFKLKEFRVMLALFNHLGEEVPIVAKFRRSGAMNLPIRFSNRVTAYPGIEFVFKFMAKVSIPRTNSDRPGMIRVGPQPEWAMSGSGSASRGYSDSATDAALRQARRERDRRLRNISHAGVSHAERITPEPVSSLSSDMSMLANATSHAASNMSSFANNNTNLDLGNENVSTEQQERAQQQEEEEEQENGIDYDANANEIGFTQGTPTVVRGLFD